MYVPHIPYLDRLSIRLAVCIPKPCSTKLFLQTIVRKFKYTEQFCRLKDDKPWSTADTIAVVVFVIIGLLTVMSTSVDVWYTVILKGDPKNVNIVYRSFSVYNNTRRLVKYTPNPNAIECLDGVRVLAMLWVIIGHSFITQSYFYNNLDLLHWLTSPQALWIQAAPITVDTFFMLSGLLIVFTTAEKFTSVTFLKNLHLFYLNRLLRMFPILATVVLLEASFFHRWLDGPMWNMVALNTEHCRTYWWTTLLYIQNYISAPNFCISPSWYLAVDVQLHMLSPLALVGVLTGARRVAWATLATTLVGVLTAAGLYCFHMGFTASFTGLGPSIDERIYYFVNYYINTLTRASPFIVGMMYGYLLHLYRRRRLFISHMLNTFLWVFSLAILGFVAYAVLPTLQASWNNRVLDILYNTLLRPMWAAAMGWIIFACAKGYGGPVNWFLSLRVWKLPSRISYAMYLFHFSLILTMNGTRTEPIWFSPLNIIFLFFAYVSITFIVAFIATVLIDSPAMMLIKSSMEKGNRR
ncbi:O-acyltransferase like protein-like isoform X2 [Epargyreus clarus]|uniref:O-acyltransferase like protein-like isoform X2 n=1 Tax=Epargyreus clarus TaxID=520877 RepID=UPI003C2BD1ED